MKKIIACFLVFALFFIPIIFAGCETNNLNASAKQPVTEETLPKNENQKPETESPKTENEPPKIDGDVEPTLTFEFFDYSNSQDVTYDFGNKKIYVKLNNAKAYLTFNCRLKSGTETVNQVIYYKFGKDENFKTESTYNYVFVTISEKGNFSLILFDANELAKVIIDVVVE